jgi:hypothetical protein
LDDIPENVGQAKIPTVVTISQFGVIEAQQSQNGGVQVMDLDSVFHCLGAEFVGCAINSAAFGPATRHPGAKALIVVVAARILMPISVASRFPSEFATPDDRVTSARLCDRTGRASLSSAATKRSRTSDEIKRVIPIST